VTSPTEEAALHGLLQLMTSLQRRALIDERDVRQIGAVMANAAARVGSFTEQDAVMKLIEGAIDEIVAFPPDRPRRID
jgi:hypothetical protein